MVSLPPHTSHQTQPLNLSFFGPLKLQYHKECDLFMKINHIEKITPYDIAHLFSKAYLKTANAEKAAKGFAAAGNWPVDPDKFVDMYVLTETTDDAVEPIPSTNDTTQMPTDFGELHPPSPTSGMIPSSIPTPDAPDSQIPSTREGKGEGRKQDLQILTSTPMKIALEINTLKTMKQEKAQQKGKGKKTSKD